MKFPSIYLASKSPRRQELLSQIEVNFSVLSIDVDETAFANETPLDYVQRVAIAKAQAGWNSLAEQDQKPVLGSDTSVVINSEILGKPTDDSDATAMLQKLSGNTHQVMTAVAIVTSSEILCKVNISKVTFALLSAEDIAWYLSTKEGCDKAGSYAVQGLAAVFIENIEGSYSGIMGLPVRDTALLLKQI
ncbi:MAG: septum formation inhibitor Maf [Gammaproteobacteria bacterium]|nr:MAG: septum formation inhibitor Maf [Gammaproteobacteria bacterium]